jgi:hypothetical protein
MTSQELQSLLTTIVTNLDAAGSIAEGLDPAIAPYVELGKVVDTAIPGLAATVDNWISGAAPTPAEIATQAAELAILQNPNLP